MIRNSQVDDLRLTLSCATEEVYQLREALAACVESLDQLLPYLGKVPADVGLLNDALCKSRPLLESKK